MPPVGDPRRFDLTADHVTLLSRSYVHWSGMEWGAAEIDGKRPYGGGDMRKDICEILGWVTDWDDVTPRQERDLFDRADKLHRETETALEVVLRTGGFEPGEYRTSGAYMHDWKRVDG